MLLRECSRAGGEPGELEPSFLAERNAWELRWQASLRKAVAGSMGCSFRRKQPAGSVGRDPCDDLKGGGGVLRSFGRPSSPEDHSDRSESEDQSGSDGDYGADRKGGLRGEP